MIRVTVWNEHLHEQCQPDVARIYPQGIHGCIAAFLQSDDMTVRTATLADPDCGFSEALLADTDVLILWGHMAHDQVTDEAAARVQRHVQAGMGLIALHSAHMSKAMLRLMGTTMTLRWRHGDRERLICTCPAHPIAQGLPPMIDIPMEEMYGEYFDIPKPDDVIYTGWFAGGEVFRSACTFTRGHGRIFYFQPGHEEYPIYHQPAIQQIIRNAVRWCAPTCRLPQPRDNMQVIQPLEGV